VEPRARLLGAHAHAGGRSALQLGSRGVEQLEELVGATTRLIKPTPSWSSTSAA
jgi:hypothetical protein